MDVCAELQAYSFAPTPVSPPQMMKDFTVQSLLSRRSGSSHRREGKKERQKVRQWRSLKPLHNAQFDLRNRVPSKGAVMV